MRSVRHEQDLRALVRRDRNSPSVIIWSFGNEVGEQYTGKEGATMAMELNNIIKEEDSTRPTTSAMNYASPEMPFPATMDIISLNYQGEGIRNSPEFGGANKIWGTQFLKPAEAKKAFGTDETDLGLSIFRVRLASDSTEWPFILRQFGFTCLDIL